MMDTFRQRNNLISDYSDSSLNCLGTNKQTNKQEVQPSIARLLIATYQSEKIHVRKWFTIASRQRKCHYQLIQAGGNFQAQHLDTFSKNTVDLKYNI